MPRRSASYRGYRPRMSQPRSTGSKKYFASALKRETAMSSEKIHPDMRHLWQGQAVEDASMSLDELRSALAKLHRVERTQTVACGLVSLLFVVACGGLLMTAAPIPIVRGAVGVFAMIAG